MTEQTLQGFQSWSRQDFEKDVIRRAQEDSAFRHRLLSDSRAAIQSAYGVELRSELQIRVLEESPSTLYLVLPAKTDELSDEQLASVSGGLDSRATMIGGGRFYDYLKSSGLER